MLHADIEIAGKSPGVAHHDKHSTASLQARLQTTSGTGTNMRTTADGNKIEPIDQRRSHVRPCGFVEIGHLSNHDQSFEGNAHLRGGA